MSVTDFDRSGRKAFTMVEMLVVIVIIVMLSLLLLRSAATFGEEGRRKQAVYELQQLRNALAEFYAEYGHYPPVDFMAYEYEHRADTHQHPGWQAWLEKHNDPDNDMFPELLNPKERDTDWPRIGEVYMAGKGLGYRYGLVSYLWPRARGNQEHWYDQDTARDKVAKSRWARHLEDISLYSGIAEHSTYPSGVGIATPWSNRVATVRDPWGSQYRYVSRPPYQTYRLWSTGRGGSGNPEDNIGDEAWSE